MLARVAHSAEGRCLAMCQLSDVTLNRSPDLAVSSHVQATIRLQSKQTGPCIRTTASNRRQRSSAS